MDQFSLLQLLNLLAITSSITMHSCFASEFLLLICLVIKFINEKKN